jgi:hypothetical protein
MKKDILKSQKGVALIIALIILLVLTLIGISAINTTTYETSISGNERAGSDAFYAAEAGIEDYVRQIPTTGIYYHIDRTALGKDSFYWGGTIQDKPNGVPPKSFKEPYPQSGYDLSWTFKRYQVNSTGESMGASKEVEVQLIVLNRSPGYNN